MQHLLLSEIIVTLSNSMQLLAELKMQNVQSQDLENSTPPPDITHACPHVMQILCVHSASTGYHLVLMFCPALIVSIKYLITFSDLEMEK